MAMSYIKSTEIALRVLAQAVTGRSLLYKSASESADARGVFISHSHVDSSLAGHIAEYVATFGVPVYVDILDTELPGRSGKETADRLRLEITGHPKFIALMSENALTSRWIPWELGFADGRRIDRPIPSPDVALLPVLRMAQDWPGVEYMGLYPQIMRDDDGNTYLVMPDGKRGPRFGDWLKSTPLDRALRDYLH